MRKKQILIVCPYPQGTAAGQRLKYEQYFNAWKQADYCVDVSSFMDTATWEILYTQGNITKKIFGTIKGYYRRLLLIGKLHKYDLVYVFLWVTPFGSTLFERVYRCIGKKIVYDIEDNILDESKMVGGNALIRMLKSASKVKYLIRNANHVIASSPILSERCSIINKYGYSAYITSSIAVERYISAGFPHRPKVVIGWTGTHSSKVYLDLLIEVFQDISKKCEFKLIVIANFDYSQPGIDLEVINWRAETEIEDLQKIDIGVYPLPNDDWVSGKSGLKALQYMAMGIPVVASNVGNTPNIIKNGENGFLVNSHSEWVSILLELVQNKILRRNIGLAGRDTVIKKYSTNIVGKQYFEVINKVLK